jgi:CheY-like chemotaxis protein
MPELRPVLLVEDDQNDIDLILAALSQTQLANPIHVLRDGAEALAYLRPGLPDPPPLPAVVLLDLKMPKVDGLQVLRRMRADGALRWVPVVILTVSHAEADRLTTEQLGINAYLVKPVSGTDFINAVAAVGLQWGLMPATTSLLGR